MFMGMRDGKFKDDLEMLAKQKLQGLAVFPINITPELKTRIRDVQEEFLEARKSKKFTEEKGIAIMREIDSINKDLKSLPKRSTDDDDDDEMRKRKTIKSHTKRKIKKSKK